MAEELPNPTESSLIDPRRLLTTSVAMTAASLAPEERRNELRRKTKLPLLEVSKEWRRMKEQDDSDKFSKAFGPFAAKHRQIVWDQILQVRRETEGPEWRPSWIEGMARQGEVFRILRQRFEEERQKPEPQPKTVTALIAFGRTPHATSKLGKKVSTTSGVSGTS